MPARLNKAEKARRLRATEAMMVRGVSNRRILQRLAKDYGIAESSGVRYVNAVRAAWAKEAEGIDRTEMRAEHRARLARIYERSMSKRAVVRDDDGTVILGANGEALTVESPDLRSGLRALDSLAKLDNLNAETVKVEGAEDLVGLLRMGSVAEAKALEASGEWPRPKKKKRNGKTNGHG